MIDAALGRSLELYFINGKPDGMLTAEVFNWTGHVLMAPRTQISAALARKEARHTGVYILLGEDDVGERLAYIGESENIGDRIKNHDAKKDWWTDAALITTSANNLHKAHAKYLEARLIERAKSVGRTRLENGTAPPRASLSEAAQANMEEFLDYLHIVLPAIRIDMFLEHSKPNRATAEPSLVQPTASPRFVLTNRKHDLRATATVVDGEFIVDGGSSARAKWGGLGAWDHGYRKLHEELLRTGILQPTGDKCTFTASYGFKSPSAAAAVVNGRPSNGPLEWKIDGSDRSYKDWEAAQLDMVVEEDA